jgi:hypothetical protein
MFCSIFSPLLNGGSGVSWYSNFSHFQVNFIAMFLNIFYFSSISPVLVIQNIVRFTHVILSAGYSVRKLDIENQVNGSLYDSRVAFCSD